MYIYATLCIGACTPLASCTHSRPHSFLQRRRARPARECRMWELSSLMDSIIHMCYCKYLERMCITNVKLKNVCSNCSLFVKIVVVDDLITRASGVIIFYENACITEFPISTLCSIPNTTGFVFYIFNVMTTDKLG